MATSNDMSLYSTSPNGVGIAMDQGEDEEESTITLVDAIKTKYCSGPEKYYSDETLPVFRVIKEFAPQSKPGACTIHTTCMHTLIYTYCIVIIPIQCCIDYNTLCHYILYIAVSIANNCILK